MLSVEPQRGVRREPRVAPSEQETLVLPWVSVPTIPSLSPEALLVLGERARDEGEELRFVCDSDALQGSQDETAASCRCTS